MREGSKIEHRADMTLPSPSLTNLSLKLSITSDTNFSHAETASALCFELSLIQWPLKLKVQSPEESTGGEEGACCRKEDRTGSSLESRNLSKTETVECRRGLTEEKSMSDL